MENEMNFTIEDALESLSHTDLVSMEYYVDEATEAIKIDRKKFTDGIKNAAKSLAERVDKFLQKLPGYATAVAKLKGIKVPKSIAGLLKTIHDKLVKLITSREPEQVELDNLRQTLDAYILKLKTDTSADSPVPIDSVIAQYQETFKKFASDPMKWRDEIKKMNNTVTRAANESLLSAVESAFSEEFDNYKKNVEKERKAYNRKQNVSKLLKLLPAILAVFASVIAGVLALRKFRKGSSSEGGSDMGAAEAISMYEAYVNGEEDDIIATEAIKFGKKLNPKAVGGAIKSGLKGLVEKIDSLLQKLPGYSKMMASLKNIKLPKPVANALTTIHTKLSSLLKNKEPEKSDIDSLREAINKYKETIDKIQDTTNGIPAMGIFQSYEKLFSQYASDPMKWKAEIKSLTSDLNDLSGEGATEAAFGGDEYDNYKKRINKEKAEYEKTLNKTNKISKLAKMLPAVIGVFAAAISAVLLVKKFAKKNSSTSEGGEGSATETISLLEAYTNGYRSEEVATEAFTKLKNGVNSAVEKVSKFVSGLPKFTSILSGLKKVLIPKSLANAISGVGKSLASYAKNFRDEVKSRAAYKELQKELSSLRDSLEMAHANPNKSFRASGSASAETAIKNIEYALKSYGEDPKTWVTQIKADTELIKSEKSALKASEKGSAASSRIKVILLAVTASSAVIAAVITAVRKFASNKSAEVQTEA